MGNDEIETKIDENSWIEQLDILLKNTMKNHLINDVLLGVFLFGGLDSSSIVALVSKITNKPVKTFNISYGKKMLALMKPKRYVWKQKSFNVNIVK